RQGLGDLRLRGRGQLAGHPAHRGRRRPPRAALTAIGRGYAPDAGTSAARRCAVTLRDGEPSGTAPRPTIDRAQRCCCRITVSAISRDTAMAMYITPENIASMVRARACGESGTTSLRPTPDSVLKLRNSSSIQVRGCGGIETSLKLPG